MKLTSPSDACAVLWDSLALVGRAGALRPALSDRAAASLLISFVICHIASSTGHVAKAAKPKTSEQKWAGNLLMGDKGRQAQGGGLTEHIRPKGWSVKTWERSPSALRLLPGRPEVRMMGWGEDICRSTRGLHSYILFFFPLGPVLTHLPAFPHEANSNFTTSLGDSKVSKNTLENSVMKVTCDFEVRLLQGKWLLERQVIWHQKVMACSTQTNWHSSKSSSTHKCVNSAATRPD